jgi:DNA polymerase-1
VDAAAGLDAFREVWLVCAATAEPPGARAEPACLAARELRSGRAIRLGADELRSGREPPYPTARDGLLVAFEAGAVLGCHLALGWPLPGRVLDLAAEFRCATAGLVRPHGPGLYGALAWHIGDAHAAMERAAVARAMLGRGPWSDAERAALRATCESGVRALGRLLDAMAPQLDWPRALLRGRFLVAAARMSWAGVPLDVPTLGRLRSAWPGLIDPLIRDIDGRFGVFEGRTLRADRWAAWLERNRVAWPRDAAGRPTLDDETFREMARRHPDVALVRELRLAARPPDPFGELAIGPDGRNRARLCPFYTTTGRNQLFGSIFGPATWLRGLIRPGPGRALAYVDWAQQEFGIAAALSGDPAMLDAYESGDPYLTFAIQAGQAPPDATPEAYKPVREQFKACALGVLYGMSERGLAQRIGQPTAKGRELLRLHRETFPAYWRWSDGAEAHAQLVGHLHSAFGWTVRVGAEANPRSLRNFPMQANGAEMLRLACCLATERGVTVCVPVHDALLVEGPADGIDAVVAQTQAAMAEASEVVLSGFRLRSTAKVVRWPGRYMDARGREFWGHILARCDALRSGAAAHV